MGRPRPSTRCLTGCCDRIDGGIVRVQRSGGLLPRRMGGWQPRAEGRIRMERAPRMKRKPLPGLPGRGFRETSVRSGCPAAGCGSRRNVRVPGAGFRVPDSGCRIPGAGCRIPGAGFRVSDSGCRVSDSGCRLVAVICARGPTSARGSCPWFRAPSSRRRAPRGAT